MGPPLLQFFKCLNGRLIPHSPRALIAFDLLSWLDWVASSFRVCLSFPGMIALTPPPKDLCGVTPIAEYINSNDILMDWETYYSVCPWAQWAYYEPRFSQDFIYYLSPAGRAGYTICRAQHKMKIQRSLFKKQEKIAINGTNKDFPFFFVLYLNLSWWGFFSYSM